MFYRWDKKTCQDHNLQIPLCTTLVPELSITAAHSSSSLLDEVKLEERVAMVLIPILFPYYSHIICTLNPYLYGQWCKLSKQLSHFHALPRHKICFCQQGLPRLNRQGRSRTPVSSLHRVRVLIKRQRTQKEKNIPQNFTVFKTTKCFYQ